MNQTYQNFKSAFKHFLKRYIFILFYEENNELLQNKFEKNWDQLFHGYLEPETDQNPFRFGYQTYPS